MPHCESTKLRTLVACLSLWLAGCTLDPAAPPNALTSFKVSVVGVFLRVGDVRTALPVVASCVSLYGSQDAVPFDVKGQAGCRYVIPTGEVEFDIRADAMGVDGQPFHDFNGSVSFRVVPGDLPMDQRARWSAANLGLVETTVRALSPYGEVRIWVQDAPPALIYDGGTVFADQLPAEPVYPAKRTYAAGASPTVYFADQTLQSLQMPGVLDNRGSPFSGNFVVVGKNPTSGETLKQTCPDDPARNGHDSLMVVTGLDPAGFFITDISACRVKEMLADNAGSTVRTGEPPEPCWISNADGGRDESLDGGAGRCNISEKACTRRTDCPGYSPGTFASIFVYNYNFPDNLDEGDLLFTVSGSVQEFTSTTQLVFPAWSTAERVRHLPQDQWNKWLQFARPYDLNARTCGEDNAAVPFLTDALCGHNRRNLKMESLESALVRVRRARFPQKFQDCDFNANGSVPFFCETKPVNQDWQWNTCSFDAPEPDADRVERECNMNCTIGMADNAGVICSERSTYKGFGQYVVEMALPGPSALGLDDALSLRMQTAVAKLYVAPADAGVSDGGPLPSNPSVRVGGYAAGSEVAITCSQPTHFHPGAANVVAVDSDPVIAPGQIARYSFTGTDSAIAFQATTAQSTCTVGLNARTRINLITKDAIPELEPDCDEADPDEARATQCKYLRGAEFDIIGHLRQAQPARPRWIVIPRYVDDVCCYPGPGLECPHPIKPCQ
jgi:hypothetical protein